MSKVMKPLPGHRDSSRDVWRPKAEEAERGRGRQDRSVSRERRRSPPLSVSRRRQGGDRESYKSPVRSREFEKPLPSSQRRSRGRSRSMESRRSTRYGSMSPPRGSRNGRHADAPPESRHSTSHRHKRRHQSRSPSKRRKSRSPGHYSHKRKARRPRTRSRSHSNVRRARKDNSFSPRPRSPPKKYSRRAPPTRAPDRRDRSMSYSPPRRSPPPPRSYRQRSPPPGGRPPLLPPTRRPSPPLLPPGYPRPSSRKQSPPLNMGPRDRRPFRRRSRSRSPRRGPNSPPFRRMRTPQRSPPYTSKNSSIHRSPPPPSPMYKRRSSTPPAVNRATRLKPLPRSDRHVGETDGHKVTVDSNMTDISSDKIGTPPHRVVSILDQQGSDIISRRDNVDCDSRQSSPSHDSHYQKQQEHSDTDSLSHPPLSESRPSGPYVNPDRQRNIIAGSNIEYGSGRGRGRSQDLQHQNQIQPTHDNHTQQQYPRRGSHSSYHEQSQHHGPSHQQGPPHFQQGYRGRGRGFRGRYSPPFEQRPSTYDRRSSERGRGSYRGRGGSSHDHGESSRGIGRHRYDPQDQSLSSAEHNRQSQQSSPGGDPHHPGAEPRAKDESEENRNDSGSDQTPGENSSQVSGQHEYATEMAPPTLSAPKSPLQSLDNRAFKRIGGSNTVRNSVNQEEKANNGFRPFSISISLGKSKVGPKTAMLPKALETSREPAREPARQTGRDNGHHPDRHPDRETGREVGRGVGRDVGRGTGRDNGRHSGRDADREAGRETYRPPVSGSNSAPLGKNVVALKHVAKRDPPVAMNEPDTPKRQVEIAKSSALVKPLVATKETSIYNRLSMVGEGTYGKVYKASNNITKELVALKRIRMESEKDGFPITAVREMRLLQALKQDNVICLLEMMVEKSDFYMVFEYMDHDLTGILNHPTFRLEPCHIKHLAKQFFEGLEYLHHRGVLHRDIKGSNILLNNDGQLKIADFGLARFYTKASKKQLDYTNRIITLWYRPPEILLGATAYGPAVDIWSAGCVFIELFTRQPVFTGKNEIDQLDIIYNVMGTPTERVWAGLKETPWYGLLKTPARRRPKFRAKYEPLLPPSALELVTQMLEYDPDKRPTAEDCLKHRYFSEEPAPAPPLGLRDLKGDWHEYESKIERRKEREINDKKKRAQHELEKKKWRENREAEKKKIAQQEYDPERAPISESTPTTANSSVPIKRKRDSLEAEDLMSGTNSVSRKRVE